MVLHFRCPECHNGFMINGYWNWVLNSSFHWFGARWTKCPYCRKRPLMKWFAIFRKIN